MPYKIALIGGGSSIFTPQLVALFIKSSILRGSTITLMDINPRRLQLMENLSRHLIQTSGADLQVESTTDRRAALTGADFVICAISVGGFDAWEKDIEIPAKYGVYQPICDAVGPGGMMRAFRHLLPMVELCHELEEVSPKAWVFNYTNPATILGRAMRKKSTIRSVALCTNTVYLRDAGFLASWAGVEPEELVLPPLAAGINHCAAIVDLKLKDGRDAFPLIREHVMQPVVQWGLDNYGVLPYAWGHWLEFYPSLCKLETPYNGRLQGARLKYGVPVKDMAVERARVAGWEELVIKAQRGEGEITVDNLPPTEPVQVVEIMEALLEGRREMHVVNIPNEGAIDNLPHDAIVEVSALTDGQRIVPVHVGPLPEAMATFLKVHIQVQELTVEAGLTGDRKTALQAFELDPFIQAALPIEEIPKMLDELLAAHAGYLPQFR